MQESFLDEIINSINWEGIEKDAFVFPNKRACTYFKDKLMKEVARRGLTIWSPAIISIEEFAVKISGLKILDSFSLTFELYQIFKKYFENETFKQFYEWAPIFLSDFNEVDLNLVDPQKIYKAIAEFQMVEHEPDFWSEENSNLSRNRFHYFWKNLYPVYQEFTTHITELRSGYYGWIIRCINEQLPQISQEILFRKTYFCGFSMLNEGEIQLFEFLIQKGKAQAFWDLDSWYFDNKNQEAGTFFRAIAKRNLIDNKQLIPNNIFKNPKEIHFVKTVQDVSQAKSANALLKEIIPNQTDWTSTVIVLLEPNLLFPILNAIPNEIQELNVSMGYSLKLSPLYAFFTTYIKLFQNLKYEKGTPFFQSIDLLNWVKNPFFSYLNPMTLSEIQNFIIDRNDKFVAKNLIVGKLNHIETQKLLDIPEVPSELLSRMLHIINIIRSAIQNSEETQIVQVEIEILFTFHKVITRFIDKFHFDDIAENIAELSWIFETLIARESINFLGDPVKGLQITGLIETKCLDFDNVIILGANEGKLPNSHRNDTFIPFELVQAYKMLTFHDKESNYAYLFYRLLQKSRKIYYVFNETERDEKSRYLLQLENEFIPNPNTIFSERTFISEAPSIKPTTWQFPKNEAVMEKLHRLCFENEEYKSAGISATFFETYLNCGFKFYYSYILDLFEPEELDESLTAKGLGLVVHAVLQDLYTPYISKPVTYKDFEPIKANIGHLVKKYLEKEIIGNKNYKIIEGENELYELIINKIVEKLVNKDRSKSGLKIINLEGRMKANANWPEFPNLILKGTVDRIDSMKEYSGDEFLRIIDYKTGSVNSTNFKNIKDVLEKPEKKVIFQLFFYSLLAHKKGLIGRREFKLGVYALKELNDGLKMVKEGSNEKVFTTADLKEFESAFKEKVKEMLDPNLPFISTTDPKNCSYCPYKSICEVKL